MTKKSRLGQGLGALFPDIPGNNRSQRPSDSSIIDHNNGAAPEDVSPKSGTSAEETVLPDKSSNAHVTVSKNTSNATGRSVSRETSTKKASKRRSIPSLEAIAHPSDVFFDATVQDHNDNTKDASSSSARSATRWKLTEDEGSVVGLATIRHQSVGQGREGDVDDEADSTLTKNNNDSVAQFDNLHENAEPRYDGLDTRGKTLDVASDVPGSGVARTQSDDSTSDDSVEKDVDDKSNGLSVVQGGYLDELAIADITPNSQQPRTIFDEEDLRELADSIRQVGVLQPVVVRKIDTTIDSGVRNGSSATGDDGPHVSRETSAQYELIMGERRWRASQLAGLDTIPAIVKTTADDYMLRDALLENLHRVELNPLEEAAAFQQMMDDFGLTQAELSTSVSLSRPQISNTLRLLKLPPTIQKQVASGVLSAGHARALLSLPSAADMEKLARRIIAEGLSVRSTEEIVAVQSGAVGEKKSAKRPNAWEGSQQRQRLENRLDTKVTITGSTKHGKIHIVYSSPEDMERIVNLLDPKGANNSEDKASKSDNWI